MDDERFKSEVMRLLGKAIEKFGEIDKRFDGVDTALESVKGEIELLSSQMSDVGFVAKTDQRRIDALEKRLDSLEGNVH